MKYRFHVIVPGAARFNARRGLLPRGNASRFNGHSVSRPIQTGCFTCGRAIGPFPNGNTTGFGEVSVAAAQEWEPPWYIRVGPASPCK
jgi:hypothetical protein